MSDLKEKRAIDAQAIVDILLSKQSAEPFIEHLDDLLKGWLCFDPSADDSTQRNDKIYSTERLVEMLKQVHNYEKEYIKGN